ncbi:Uncharacterised protein [BD1-7 clade bacterium]|uniref:MerC mercury resistance protein n=1 Tax=BD1-7 clade bacterium TaxID=2029982 RepID=A0A5S9QWG8_9GAMM|nr:Uncharacterised protein [BD1-7 clade bacterium]
MTTTQSALDKTAGSLAILCAVHCFSTPLALTLLPTLAATAMGDEGFHLWMLGIVIPLSILALWIGYQKHRNRQVFFFALPGLFMLLLAGIAGHSWLNESAERIITLAGAALLSISHLLNTRASHAHSKNCRVDPLPAGSQTE